ncbi:MAG: carbamate kinase [Clostridiales bacterium]|nr:carbamate kinase [Clostridiales bacterium]MDR2750011.1 carbamate kinase [Clostridiales bacterium]
MRTTIALGGNALGNTLTEQMIAVKSTAKAIASLIEDGNEVVLTHGNGPQVGMINLAMETSGKTEAKTPYIPMSVCVAMSQGYIGYDLQNALREELLNRGLSVPVASIITQTIVDENDPAFQSPSKPIGCFYTEEEAKALASEKGYKLKEDAGRGWRRVVASPKPVGIVEKETVKALLSAGQVVIAAGGGGIPVRVQGNHLAGAGAVVDKDFAAAVLADITGSNVLMILTAVDKICIDFNKPSQRKLDRMTVEEARNYIKEGHFAPGSMLPKVQAAIQFVEGGPSRKAVICHLSDAMDGFLGKAGTLIY